MQQVLHQLNSDAVYRAQRESAQQCGKVGDVQLDKGRHQRNGEFDELQHGGHSRQHGSHGQAMGFLMLCHKKRLLFNGVTPLETLVSQGARIKKEHHKNAVHAFSHPDYTVGTGIAPVPARRQARSRTITAGGEFRPAPKTNYPVVFVNMIQQTAGKCKRFFRLSRCFSFPLDTGGKINTIGVHNGNRRNIP